MATPEQSVSGQWEAGFNWAITKFIITTVIMGGIVVLLFSLGSLKEIRENFPRYRCYPIFMPFASQFGYDTKENFDFCLNQIFSGKAAEVFAPIFTLLGRFTQIINLIVNVALGIRKLFSNFLIGVNGFIRNVRDRIQFLLFNIRLSFMKMYNLMGKVYGTMYAVIWMGTSAITAGMNVADNDLVRFLFEFCFDPNTPLQLADGSYIPIREARIGMRLAAIQGNPTPVVSSVFRFHGEKTPMVRINDVCLSAEHYVQGLAGQMIAAGKHPYAFPAESIPELVCLNVSGNRFSVGLSGLIVADYDEHTAPDVMLHAQRIALRALNGSESICTSNNYDLGVDGDMAIRMADGTWKRMAKICFGDDVWNAGRVLGVVAEECDAIVENGTMFSTAQLVHRNGVWERAGHSSEGATKVSAGRAILHSIITEHCSTIEARAADGTIYFLRDYREVPLPEMEEPYAAAIERS